MFCNVFNFTSWNFMKFFTKIKIENFTTISISFGAKKIIGPVPSKDMPTSSIRIAPISMKDAHSVESNEKSILRFLFFELWSILYLLVSIKKQSRGKAPHQIYIFFSQMDKIFYDKMFSKFQKWSYLHERCGRRWIESRIIFSIILIFSL